MKILFIGDVFGEPGRDLITDRLFRLRHEESIDYVIANCENASHGRGLSLSHADELLGSGIDFITLGNHAFSHRDIYDYVDRYPVVRPMNLPSMLPGKGVAVAKCKDVRIGIVNIEGRVFIDPVGDNPFEAADRALCELSSGGGSPDVIIVDFHAETTSEKKAMALYLDGRVSAVIGTHTHVQTADEQILRGGTAFITDVGMTGVCDERSIIGMDSALVTEKFVKCVPVRFEPADGKAVMNAVIIDIDVDSKTSGGLLKVSGIRRISV